MGDLQALTTINAAIKSSEADEKVLKQKMQDREEKLFSFSTSVPYEALRGHTIEIDEVDPHAIAEGIIIVSSDDFRNVRI